jgi:hypothetical protein
VFDASTTECRASEGDCDPAEFCTGASADCPADALEPSTTSCRTGTDLCDATEFCDGASPDCPSDGLEPSTTVCRAPATGCDAEELCTGSSAACPPDLIKSSGAVCRPVVGTCDVEEVCDGSSADCPADGVEASGVICREAVGECDLEEVCNGSVGSCPPNAFVLAGTTCTDDTDVCTDDQCDGAGACGHPFNTAPCDDSDICTSGDACQEGVCTGTFCANENVCLEAECTPTGCVFSTLPDPNAPTPPADFIFILDASVSMKRGLKNWISEQLCTFPTALRNAPNGPIDHRLAIVRFGTNRISANPGRGPAEPDVVLPFTTDGAAFCTTLAGMSTDIRKATEAGSEVMQFALDNLECRPEALCNIVLYTDEDDDSPVSAAEKRREPPFGGTRCYGRRCEARWLPFQQRIDNTAASLIAGQVQLNLVMRRGDRPSTSAYGDPVCTRLDADGNLDPGPTLDCLRTHPNVVGVCTDGSCSAGRIGSACTVDEHCDALSHQAHLLGSGVCESSGVCSGGRIGSACLTDADCAILARAYSVPRTRRQSDEFFIRFLDDKVREQTCREPSQ